MSATAHVPFDMTGVVDAHVHTAPDLFPRVGDDVQVATACRAAGMRGMALKSHHESTVGRAAMASRLVEGFAVVGGITLNRPVGGINPSAVEAALATGGRVVWGPTGDAAYHASISGRLGSWGAPGMDLPEREGARGITVLDEGRALTEDARAVIDLVAHYGALFCAAHISPDEIRAVLRYARERRASVLVNHVYYFPRVQLDFVREIVELGGTVEVCAALIFPFWAHNTLDQLVEIFRAVGPEHCVIASDCGGVQTPWPHDSLRMYAENLLAKGMAEAELRTMMCHNPSRLLGLDGTAA